MEPLGAFPDGEWDCFRRMISEEHDFYSLQFLNQSSILLEEHDGLNIGIQSTFSSGSEAIENECVFYNLDDHNSNLQYITQENSYNSSNCSGNNVFIANPNHSNNYFSYPDHYALANNSCLSMDFCMDEKNILASLVPLPNSDIVMEENVNLNEDEGSERLENSDHSPNVLPITKQLQLKRKLHEPEPEAPAEDKANKRSENSKIKPRVSKDGCAKNARSKKNQKLVVNENELEESNTRSDGHSSSSNITEDDNVSQENRGAATSGSKSLNSNGKTRASRGTATDPQSLYARKRRERINERLRILQNLVPNGAKVDISTMLEEAVNYVKFLQLQIKLLSSDDMWMYAPLAYNGLDIGFNLNLKNSSVL
ncbi:hypothetical protein RIF29_05935 [Crotalaria pallida]|uniref:BHLH domain-containing protein n=1 Tax=Crotalaria pallida TaxID=3830 RepID=A0AAN9PAL1_CROPI